MNQTSDVNLALAEVKNLLAQISTANGYNFDPAVRQGWLQHIFQRRAQTPPTFPILAYRPELSVPTGGDQTDNSALKDKITLVIDGAISVKDSETPVEDLFNLIKDLRRSLVFDVNSRKIKLSSIEYGECPFDVPEAGEEYAFFSQKIKLEVTENYA